MSPQVRKQREKNPARTAAHGAALFTEGVVFPPQLGPSRNPFTDIPRDLSLK